MPMEPITMSLGQKFEIEKMSRDIDNTQDVQKLRDLAKHLLVALKQQQAAAACAFRQTKTLEVPFTAINR